MSALDGALVERARALGSSGGRRLLGITGPPGAGKSSLAAGLVAALGTSAVLVEMDGFHLAQAELERLGRAGRKGAVDTFDAGGFVALLRRLRAADEDVVYAPVFRREIEEPIAGATAVSQAVSLVVAEGNYLLSDAGRFGEVRPLLDEVWYLDPPGEVRVQRLVARHIAYGRSPAAALEWVRRSDEENARLVAARRHLADLVVGSY